MQAHEYQIAKPIYLESGQILPNVKVAYHTYGQLNDRKDNVVWVCHALTANSDVFDWWKGLFGEEELFNPKDHFIVCANILGSHYGTTSPLDINPIDGENYYHGFPKFTIKDIVKVHQQLADHLSIDTINVLIGGSVGGQQVLEWGIDQPDRIKHLIPIATNAIHSPWGVAFNESQRMAIELDPTWSDRSSKAGLQGLITARSIALLSYRNHHIYNKTQSSDQGLLFPDRAISYQHYQGHKLRNRFNAFSYWYLSHAMDSHNVGRGRGGIRSALSLIRANTMVITMQEDVLFPKVEQLKLAELIPNSRHIEIPTEYGHDGFLLETERLTTEITSFFAENIVK